jgi:hypothetical protein
MISQNNSGADPSPWLLEPADPGVRYLALRDLLQLDPADPELVLARRLAHTSGPIALILQNMHPEGWWAEPGPGYLPKYRSTVWSLIMLAQLGGAIEEDERIATGCRYILEHALTSKGQFSASGTPYATVDCLQGNLCWSLVVLGCQDERLPEAYEWMARTTTGEGMAPMGEKDAVRRYYAGKFGPNFVCGSNNRLSCAWGATDVMMAFSVCPAEYRTGLVEDAIRVGAEFLFSVDPATAAYPTGYAKNPSGNWWKFGFPVFYVADILHIVDALAGLGFGSDPRLANALELVHSKQDAQGRWALEYDYSGKTWVDLGEKHQPNKWVTIRALRALDKCALAAAEP